MRTRCKFRVVGVEDTENKVFKKIWKGEISDTEFDAIPGTEFAESYGARKGEKYKSVDTGKFLQNVRLCASYDTSNPEDVSFSEATPSGELKIFVSNPVVVRPGKNYYLDLIPCE